MAKKVENTIAAMTGFPGDGGLGKPEDTDEEAEPKENDTEEQEEADNVVDFPVPEGFKPPEGVKQGDEFTALASLKLDEDGDLQLTKIDGIPVKGESEEHEEEEENNREGEQNTPGATGAEGAIPSGGNTAIASARNVMGEMGMPA